MTFTTVNLANDTKCNDVQSQTKIALIKIYCLKTK